MHFTLRKLDQRLQLICEATRKNGGIYLYSNQLGCDGDRLYYDGSALIIVNGDIVAQGSQFGLKEVEVVTATVDLEEVRAAWYAPSRTKQAIQAPKYRRIETDFTLCVPEDRAIKLAPSPVIRPRILAPEQEIAHATGCWLWDYLRRSGTAGFLIPLVGIAIYVARLSLTFAVRRHRLVCYERPGLWDVLSCHGRPQRRELSGRSRCSAAGSILKRPAEDATGIVQQSLPHSLVSIEPLSRLQVSNFCSMGMRTQSSKETRSRAKELSETIGSFHVDMDIDEVFAAQKNTAVKYLSFEPRFRVHGGSNSENLALQNIQARSRMVTAYYYAQLLPTIRKRPGGGNLLVLGSANVGESLSGYDKIRLLFRRSESNR